MELSRLYYEKNCKPVIEKEAEELAERIAVGLVGEGSECYGYDDEISRDHDFGPSCCFWLTKEDYRTYGEKLREILDSLPKSFMSFPALKALKSNSPAGNFFATAFIFKASVMIKPLY